jgi:predicted DNA binding CopG/RHH family protein
MGKIKQARKVNLPDFNKMSDQEIADFWRKHDATEFWGDMNDVAETFVDVRPKKAISMRFDEKDLSAIKNFAREKGIGYQTLMRMWVIERLATELKKTS